ncbi:MAG: hypothetical protein K0R18_322 [Bacillales bacterium]|jgi:hypothetical protein|nr:hypothetical protein [Bacillales bacterium]
MPEVKWYQNNRENMMNRAQETGKVRKKYFHSSLGDILLNWGPKEDIKYIKISYGRGNWLEFDIYNSGPYLTQLKKVRKHVVPVEGLFFLMVRSDHKVGETASQVLAMIEDIGKNFSKIRLEDSSKWITLDRVNEMLLEIEEILENVEEYRVMDEMMDSL